MCNIRKPTDKMMQYAFAIAEFLNLEKPEGDFDSFSNFISKYSDRYRIECGKLRKSISNSTVSKKTTEWMFENLYKKQGLYAFINNCEVVYIGKSTNLAERIESSYTQRIKETQIDFVMYYLMDNLTDLNIMELVLIAEYKPLCNSDCKSQEKSDLFKSGIDILKDFSKLAE